MKYDVLILGGGPAGMTAALYCIRSGLKTAIISKDIGGTANHILRLENWPGFSGEGGKLMKKFYEHLEKYDVKFILKEIKKIEKRKKDFSVLAGSKRYLSKSLIVCTGTEKSRLEIPGEEKFLGKGVSNCITCDAFFYKNKDVAVIGGSDCAAGSALSLANVAKNVYIFYKGEKLDCNEERHKKLEKKKNVKIFYSSLPIKISGKKKVEKIKIKDFSKNKEKEFNVQGVFVENNSNSLSDFLGSLDLKFSKNKKIKVNKKMETSVKGIYAAGDITDQELEQVVVASGQGAIAGKNSSNYVHEQNNP